MIEGKLTTAEIKTEVTLSETKPADGKPIVAIMPMKNTERTHETKTIPYPGPFIIGCDLAQGESVAGQIKLSRADGMEVRDG